MDGAKELKMPIIIFYFLKTLNRLYPFLFQELLFLIPLIQRQ